VPSFIWIHPTVWPQYTNVTDRTGQDRQRFDSIGRIVLQMVAQKWQHKPISEVLLFILGVHAVSIVMLRILSSHKVGLISNVYFRLWEKWNLSSPILMAYRYSTSCLQSHSFFRLHRRTMYVDMAYCYRRTSVVCRSVCLSVYHTTELCKNGEPIEMPFGLRTQVDTGNHVLKGN